MSDALLRIQTGLMTRRQLTLTCCFGVVGAGLALCPLPGDAPSPPPGWCPPFPSPTPGGLPLGGEYAPGEKPLGGEMREGVPPPAKAPPLARARSLRAISLAPSRARPPALSSELHVCWSGEMPRACMRDRICEWRGGGGEGGIGDEGLESG